MQIPNPFFRLANQTCQVDSGQEPEEKAQFGWNRAKLMVLTVQNYR